MLRNSVCCSYNPTIQPISALCAAWLHATSRAQLVEYKARREASLKERRLQQNKQSIAK
jgi:hypothetical protein